MFSSRLARLLPSLLAVAGLVWLAPPAAATPFDLIYTNHLRIDMCATCHGFSERAPGFAILVNPGTDPFTEFDMAFARFNLTCNDPNYIVGAGINYYPGAELLGPREALGSVVDSRNGVLLPLLAAGESLLNLYPRPALVFGVFHTAGPAPPARLHIEGTVEMGRDVAHIAMDVEIYRPLAPPWLVGNSTAGVQYLKATRVSSVKAPLPATWGRVKAAYR